MSLPGARFWDEKKWKPIEKLLSGGVANVLNEWAKRNPGCEKLKEIIRNEDCRLFCADLVKATTPSGRASFSAMERASLAHELIVSLRDERGANNDLEPGFGFRRLVKKLHSKVIPEKEKALRAANEAVSSVRGLILSCSQEIPPCGEKATKPEKQKFEKSLALRSLVEKILADDFKTFAQIQHELKAGGRCRGEWLFHWSEALKQRDGKVGPFHGSKPLLSLDTIDELLTKLTDQYDQTIAHENAIRNSASQIFMEVRDMLDARSIEAATQEPFTANRVRAMRKADETANKVRRLILDGGGKTTIRNKKGEITRTIDLDDLQQRVLGDEHQNIRQIQARLKNDGRCKGAWLERWSEAHKAFYKTTGPFHGDTPLLYSSSIDEMLDMLDPRTGKYRDLISLTDGASQFMDGLGYIGADAVEGDDTPCETETTESDWGNSEDDDSPDDESAGDGWEDDDEDENQEEDRPDRSFNVFGANGNDDLLSRLGANEVHLHLLKLDMPTLTGVLKKLVSTTPQAGSIEHYLSRKTQEVWEERLQDLAGTNGQNSLYAMDQGWESLAQSGNNVAPLTEYKFKIHCDNTIASLITAYSAQSSSNGKTPTDAISRSPGNPRERMRLSDLHDWCAGKCLNSFGLAVRVATLIHQKMKSGASEQAIRNDLDELNVFSIWNIGKEDLTWDLLAKKHGEFAGQPFDSNRFMALVIRTPEDLAHCLRNCLGKRYTPPKLVV